MKTIAPIELNDQQRNTLANLIDGKTSKRLATRAEIVAICIQHVGGLASQQSNAKLDKDNVFTRQQSDPLSLIDDEDTGLLKGKSPSYVRGWNQVKRRGNAA